MSGIEMLPFGNLHNQFNLIQKLEIKIMIAIKNFLLTALICVCMLFVGCGGEGKGEGVNEGSDPGETASTEEIPTAD